MTCELYKLSVKRQSTFKYLITHIISLIHRLSFISTSEIILSFRLTLMYNYDSQPFQMVSPLLIIPTFFLGLYRNVTRNVFASKNSTSLTAADQKLPINSIQLKSESLNISHGENERTQNWAITKCTWSPPKKVTHVVSNDLMESLVSIILKQTIKRVSASKG